MNSQSPEGPQGPSPQRKEEGLAPLPTPALRVAIAASEAAPFAKTGGLADVAGALPAALEQMGVDVSLIVPAYRSVLQGAHGVEDTGVRLSVPISNRREEALLLRGRLGKEVPVYLVRADRYFDRDRLYTAPEGDYPDNAERFAFFSRAVLEVLRLQPPDLLHAHDWQTALSIAFLKSQPYLYPDLARVKTVLTVHNLGYQGQFPSGAWHLLGLDASLFTPRYLEFYGGINFLKGGLVYADAITTVSPTYAKEIQTAEQGFGLDGVLRERAADLLGILNGVDYAIWDPATDPAIARRYDVQDPSGKRACKADLQRALGLSQDLNAPLVGMVSRLAAQKGFDLLDRALEGIMRRGVQLAILGTGDRRHEDLMRGWPNRYPGQVAVRIAFDEALAHRIEAGADLFLMPSRYEPGGLNQVYSLRYGTIPVVRATGGLKDTVEEFDPQTGRGTGFLFGPYEAQALLAALDRALAAFRRKEVWAALMRNAMMADFSWDRSARAYRDLYARLLGAPDLPKP